MQKTRHRTTSLFSLSFHFVGCCYCSVTVLLIAMPIYSRFVYALYSVLLIYHFWQRRDHTAELGKHQKCKFLLFFHLQVNKIKSISSIISERFTAIVMPFISLSEFIKNCGTLTTLFPSIVMTQDMIKALVFECVPHELFRWSNFHQMWLLFCLTSFQKHIYQDQAKANWIRIQRTNNNAEIAVSFRLFNCLATNCRVRFSNKYVRKCAVNYYN